MSLLPILKTKIEFWTKKNRKKSLFYTKKDPQPVRKKERSSGRNSSDDKGCVKLFLRKCYSSCGLQLINFSVHHHHQESQMESTRNASMHAKQRIVTDIRLLWSLDDRFIERCSNYHQSHQISQGDQAKSREENVLRILHFAANKCASKQYNWIGLAAEFPSKH